MLSRQFPKPIQPPVQLVLDLCQRWSGRSVLLITYLLLVPACDWVGAISSLSKSLCAWVSKSWDDLFYLLLVIALSRMATFEFLIHISLIWKCIQLRWLNTESYRCLCYWSLDTLVFIVYFFSTLLLFLLVCSVSSRIIFKGVNSSCTKERKCYLHVILESFS